MGLERFAVVLNNPTGVYFPGQVVSGQVEVCNIDWEPEKLKSCEYKRITTYFMFKPNYDDGSV